MMTRIEFLEKWIAALHSGEYTQGNDKLRVEDSYCCLGVACDLAMKNDVIAGGWLKTPCGWQFEWGSRNWESEFLPSNLGVFLGLDGGGDLPVTATTLRIFLSKKGLGQNINWEWLGATGINEWSRPKLIFLNDKGATFEEIALIIEEFLLKPLKAGENYE